MIKKIIYVVYQPMTAKLYEDFYFENCIDKGFEVEYWDISQLYFPSIDQGKSIDFAGIRYITSFRELKILLSQVQVKHAFFVITTTYTFKVWRLFLLLTSYNCIISFFARGMFPSVEKTESLKIIEVITSFDYKRLIRGFQNKIAIMLKQFNLVKKYDFIFTAGSEGYKAAGSGYNLDISTAKIIDINYYDYDKYLSTINEKPILEQKYCAFLDEYLPHHPDVEISGMKTVSANEYYSQLNSFFDSIERKFNIPVIIAAHPKAIKYRSENPFERRMIIFGKSCELAKDAMFVMTHHSTSMSYPILFEKPLFFLTSQSQKKIMYPLYEITLYFGEYLNCKVIHFDSFDDKEDLKLYVDIERYNDYKYKYLTSKGSESKQTSQIFIETISQL